VTADLTITARGDFKAKLTRIDVTPSVTLQRPPRRRSAEIA
jgi:hypothetical protein